MNNKDLHKNNLILIKSYLNNLQYQLKVIEILYFLLLKTQNFLISKGIYVNDGGSFKEQYNKRLIKNKDIISNIRDIISNIRVNIEIIENNYYDSNVIYYLNKERDLIKICLDTQIVNNFVITEFATIKLQLDKYLNEENDMTR